MHKIILSENPLRHSVCTSLEISLNELCFQITVCHYINGRTSGVLPLGVAN